MESFLKETSHAKTVKCKLEYFSVHCTKKKFSLKDLFSKCDQILRKLRIWSLLLMKSFMKNFIFCLVVVPLPSHDNIMKWSIDNII